MTKQEQENKSILIDTLVEDDLHYATLREIMNTYAKARTVQLEKLSYSDLQGMCFGRFGELPIEH